MQIIVLSLTDTLSSYTVIFERTLFLPFQMVGRSNAGLELLRIFVDSLIGAQKQVKSVMLNMSDTMSFYTVICERALFLPSQTVGRSFPSTLSCNS